VLYVDVDSLRPMHLGCYGYHRQTSPTVDALAARGVTFTNCYVSDAPCLPSRTAFALGRFGIRSGVVGHGGLASEPFPLGARRGFSGAPGFETLFQAFRRAEHYPCAITPFPNRHVAPWYTLGLREWHNPGKGGFELAHEVNQIAEPWLETHAHEENWFLAVNYWDAHAPYRTPLEYGNPFADDPPVAWHTQELLESNWRGYGPNSAQDAPGVWAADHRRDDVPRQIKTLEDYKRWIDAFDTGIRYFDDHLARLLGILERRGVLDDTLIVVSADHGEAQGEHNVYGDHQLADSLTCRVPFVASGPGFRGGRVNKGLHYQFDLMAAILETAGGRVPEAWDARSPRTAWNSGEDGGRAALVVSQMAWTYQRSVRWGDHLMTRTYHDGFKDLPDVALYNVIADPHELHDLAPSRPDLVGEGLRTLEAWHFEMLRGSRAPDPIDPMQIALREGDPWQVRGRLPWYLDRLRATDRAHHAAALEQRHGHQR
jgi:arylsulfatase A-like enzyme